MGYDGKGTIYVPLVDFYEFLAKYHSTTTGEVAYGPPRIQSGAEDLEVDYAYSTECHPADWAEPPEFLKKK